MLHNIKSLYLHCVFHGIRFKVNNEIGCPWRMAFSFIVGHLNNNDSWMRSPLYSWFVTVAPSCWIKVLSEVACTLVSNDHFTDVKWSFHPCEKIVSRAWKDLFTRVWKDQIVRNLVILSTVLISWVGWLVAQIFNWLLRYHGSIPFIY